jgi:hypothetical protein
VFLIFHTSIALLVESAVFSTTVVPCVSTLRAVALSYPVQTGLLGLFSLLGFVLV